MRGRKEPFINGVLLMIGSASCLSLIGLFGKLELVTVSLPTLIFWRYFSAFLACLCLIWSLGKLKRSHFSFHAVPSQFIRSCLVLSSQYSFFYYISKANLLDATVLLNTGPLFIPLIEKFILKKRVSRSTWVALFLSFFGVLLILQPNKDIFSLLSLIGILAGLCQGASQVLFGITAQTEKSYFNVLYLLFFCSLISLLPYSLFAPSLEAPLNIKTFLLILGIGLTSMGNQVLRAEAYQHGAPSKLSPFFYISVVLSGLFDWIFFDKFPNLLSISGIFFVLFGGFLKIYLKIHRTQVK